MSEQKSFGQVAYENGNLWHEPWASLGEKRQDIHHKMAQAVIAAYKRREMKDKSEPKSFWRLLEEGEMIQHDDSFWNEHVSAWWPMGWTSGVAPGPKIIVRRRVSQSPEESPSEQFERMVREAMKFASEKCRDAGIACNASRWGESLGGTQTDNLKISMSLVSTPLPKEPEDAFQKWWSDTQSNRSDINGVEWDAARAAWAAALQSQKQP